MGLPMLLLLEGVLEGGKLGDEGALNGLQNDLGSFGVGTCPDMIDLISEGSIYEIVFNHFKISPIWW